LDASETKRDVVKRFSATMKTLAAGLNARRVFVFVLLFAFLAQAQIAAAHFHIGIDAKEQALFGLADAKAPAKNKAPSGDRDCPISQLVAASHSYVGGADIALPLPVLVAERVFIRRDESRVVALVALNWHSRAPPCDFSKA
jgi:hypothetical protein